VKIYNFLIKTIGDNTMNVIIEISESKVKELDKISFEELVKQVLQNVEIK
jgi:hypothetical protein